MDTNQQVKPDVAKRDRRALMLGVVLGIIAGPLTIASVYAAGIVFMIFSVLLPLIVSLVARNRVTTLALVPNALMALTCLLIFWALEVSSPGPASRHDASDIALGIITVVAATVIPALLVSGLVKFVRSRRAGANTADI
jgi:hypothetical protein